MWILLTTLILASALNSDEVMFNHFMQKHNKTYDRDIHHRFTYFSHNLDIIRKLNAQSKDEGSDLVFGINHFSDLHPKEFKNKILMKTVTCETHLSKKFK